MIRKVICIISMVIVFTMLCSSCNDIPPAENPSNSVSAESSPLTEEELEHLRTVRAAVDQHMRVADTTLKGFGTIQYLETEIEKRKNDPAYVISLEPFRYEVACDPTRDEYHSPDVAEQLEKGMFINEVRELLGRSHGTTFSFDASAGFNDVYTAYTLDDGRVLFLRFIQASIKDYSREELESRIPNFNEKDWELRFNAIITNDPNLRRSVGWFKLQEVQVLALEEYLETDLRYTRTPNDELPDEYKKRK